MREGGSKQILEERKEHGRKDLMWRERGKDRRKIGKNGGGKERS